MMFTGGASVHQQTLCRGAFARFSSLLYGLIAPYFDTESELDSLLEVPSFQPLEHARRLNDLLLPSRPAELLLRTPYEPGLG